MAQQTINVGAAPNDGTGTPLRTAFQYTNSNFSELYTAVGPSGNNIVVPGNATITGDLTVDTSTLKVDSANDRVGVGIASSLLAKLHVSSTGAVHINQRTGSNGCFTQYIDPVSSNYVGTDSGNFRVANNSAQDLLNIQQLGVFTFGDGAGGTRMTLNSTGLGVGGSPAAKLSVVGGNIRMDNNQGLEWGGANNYIYGSEATDFIALVTNGVEALRINNSQNVGIGVTPSAWLTGVKALDIGSSGLAAYSGGITHNAYFDNTDSRWEYKGTGAATFYNPQNGIHQWFVAASGIANNPITTFANAAMTLDASGNLLVGKSVSLFSTVGVEASGTGFISATNSESTNAATNLSVYSTGAAAFRFYVGLGGTVYATNTTISAISDARLKENVQDIDVGLGAILALKPRKFDWKAGKGKDIKGDRGFIAQEFEQVFPQLVDEWKDPAPEGEAPYKSVRQDLIPVLVKAIQELAAEVNALKNA